ncbi:ester cyclase [Ruegeria sediminis]|uniref:Ester cyclase n=1 Tax=Ruegeria sediminis TaxID=2583820 RepID=A0ABY2X1N2_9RHOB|nr:ester cyclase [Ruegeria sediminis]TMV09120.1 ester cyclase [Ruegeria sediminis]
MTLSDLIERFYNEAWNLADHDCAREILHPQFDFRGSLGPKRSGPDEFIRYMEEVRETLPDFQCNIIDIVDAGQTAAARMSFVGTHQGKFFDVDGTKQRIEWSGAAFFALQDQKIGKLWVLGDIDAIKRQLNVHPNVAFLEP